MWRACIIGYHNQFTPLVGIFPVPLYREEPSRGGFFRIINLRFVCLFGGLISDFLNILILTSVCRLPGFHGFIHWLLLLNTDIFWKNVKSLQESIKSVFHYPLSGRWDNETHVTGLRKYHGKKIEKLIKCDQ